MNMVIRRIGNIKVSLLDDYGNSLKDVTVVLYDSMGETANGTTNSAGTYTFTSLDAGTYSIAADKPNYRSKTESGVVLLGGDKGGFAYRTIPFFFKAGVDVMSEDLNLEKSRFGTGMFTSYPCPTYRMSMERS
jgi:hypothetical protein